MYINFRNFQGLPSPKKLSSGERLVSRRSIEAKLSIEGGKVGFGCKPRSKGQGNYNNNVRLFFSSGL